MKSEMRNNVILEFFSQVFRFGVAIKIPELLKTGAKKQGFWKESNY